MTSAEREAQITAVQKEIDDLDKQIAEADDDGDTRLAGHLRDRIHKAKKQFTVLQQSGDDQVSDEAHETASDESDVGTDEAPEEETGAEDGNESEEAAGDEAASSDDSESE